MRPRLGTTFNLVLLLCGSSVGNLEAARVEAPVFEEDGPAFEEDAPSPRSSFWTSLLIPGWGQFRQGNGASGKRFVAVELTLWAGVVGFNHLHEIRQDHYRTYAAEHAGATPNGKGNGYFDDLGFYDSRLEHNQFARRAEGADAARYPSDPEFHWEWDTAGSRGRYRKLRNASENADRQALFAAGLLVVNHLFSAVHAAKTGSSSVDSGSGDDSVSAESGPRPSPEDRIGTRTHRIQLELSPMRERPGLVMFGRF